MKLTFTHGTPNISVSEESKVNGDKRGQDRKNLGVDSVNVKSRPEVRDGRRGKCHTKHTKKGGKNGRSEKL
jgi:hypothetical protein